jgi:hypothetical protein
MPTRRCQTLEEQSVAAIAASLRAVVVGVYDDESYIIWQL